jgi:hypothetical protein
MTIKEEHTSIHPQDAIMRIKYDLFFILLTTLCLAISGCMGAQIASPTSTPTLMPTVTSTPTATPIPLPALTLIPGDFYFSFDGTQSFIFSRNIAGYQQSDYYQLLDFTKTGGSTTVRIQLDSMGMGYTKTGAVEETWTKQWEQVFDNAYANGIYIIPVFGVWYDWNTGPGYSTWKSNPLNEANGGPTKTPAELFQSDSASQKLWLQWVKSLVDRWQTRKNIAAWEIFSEVNLASGVSEAEGIDFVNSAMPIIRTSDPSHRPITASLADDGKWPNFYRRASIDFINIHPYPLSGQLDRNIISGVRQVLVAYNKPVLIGESGLSFETPDSNPATLTTAANASLGIRHAIWAGIVSGAMNGRSLWWEDGYGIYFPSLKWPFLEKYAAIELPAAEFINDVDISGYRPLTVNFPAGTKVWGAVVGNEKMVIGWFRDASCEPPDWPLQSVISKQNVMITVPGSARDWQVDFYNTEIGTNITSSVTVTRKGNNITFFLPDFTDDIAFKMYIKE